MASNLSEMQQQKTLTYDLIYFLRSKTHEVESTSGLITKFSGVQILASHQD